MREVPRIRSPLAQVRRMGCALQPIPNGGLPSRTKPRAGARYTVRDTWWVPIRRPHRTTPPRAGVPRAKHVRHLLWVQDTSGPRHRHLAPLVARAERALAESLAPSRGVRRDSKPLGLPPTLAAVVSEQQDTPRGFDSRSGPRIFLLRTSLCRGMTGRSHGYRCARPVGAPWSGKVHGSGQVRPRLGACFRECAARRVRPDSDVVVVPAAHGGYVKPSI